MQLLSPLSALFGLALPAIVLMYLFKRTYMDTEIASHMLWNRSAARAGGESSVAKASYTAAYAIAASRSCYISACAHAAVSHDR